MIKQNISPIEKSSKQSVQHKLDVIRPMRKGKVKAIVDGEYGRCMPIMVTNCICCRRPSPGVSDGRFICRKCVVVFPKRKGIIFTEEGFKDVTKSESNTAK